MTDVGEGLKNNALLTDALDNIPGGKRIDCQSSGTIDEKSGNKCADGSNFSAPPEVE